MDTCKKHLKEGCEKFFSKVIANDASLSSISLLNDIIKSVTGKAPFEKEDIQKYKTKNIKKSFSSLIDSGFFDNWVLEKISSEALKEGNLLQQAGKYKVKEILEQIAKTIDTPSKGKNL